MCVCVCKGHDYSILNVVINFKKPLVAEQYFPWIICIYIYIYNIYLFITYIYMCACVCVCVCAKDMITVY